MLVVSTRLCASRHSHGRNACRKCSGEYLSRVVGTRALSSSLSCCCVALLVIVSASLLPHLCCAHRGLRLSCLVMTTHVLQAYVLSAGAESVPAINPILSK